MAGEHGEASVTGPARVIRGALPGQAVERSTAPLERRGPWSQILGQPEDRPFPHADLTAAPVGTRDAPGDSSVLPIARRAARRALSGKHWRQALPAPAVLEPEAVDALLEWLPERVSE